MLYRRKFAIIAALTFLVLAAVALGWILSRSNHFGHVVMIQAVDDATGKPLPVAVEFPPSAATTDPWMPEADVKSPERLQLKWDDSNRHVVRVVSANHVEKEITLDAQSSGDVIVRLETPKN